MAFSAAVAAVAAAQAVKAGQGLGFRAFRGRAAQLTRARAKAKGRAGCRAGRAQAGCGQGTEGMQDFHF